MTSADSSSVDKSFLANSMAAFIQIGAVALLIYWCFTIVSPFLNVVIWAAIISVAIYPAFVSLARRLGGREKTSAAIIVLIGLAIIIIPAWLLADSTIGALKDISVAFEGGTVSISQPSDSVADWPLIGDKAHEIWSSAATNLEATVNKFEPQIRSAGRAAVGLAGSTLSTVLLFILATIIGGALLTSADAAYRATRNIAARIAGVERGHSLTDLSIDTVRSVVKGVLGVAVIQMLLAAVGLVAAGVPAAGLWAGAILVLAIVQLPPLIIMGPIAVWVFSVSEPVPATVFLIYALIVSFSDTFLKPMLLGRGVEVPMLVILLGAIGGAITQGIVGLFIGSVILSVGYEIFAAWVSPDETQVALEED